MTNKEIEQVLAGLMSLREDATVRLPARTSFALTRNIRLLQPIVEDLITSRRKVLETYGEEDPNNESVYTVSQDKQTKVIEELQALDTVENDVPVVKIKLNDLDNVELSVNVMDAIYPLIEEES